MFLYVYTKGTHTDLYVKKVDTDLYTSLEELYQELEEEGLEDFIVKILEMQVQAIPSFCYNSKDLTVSDYFFDWINLHETDQEIVYAYNRYVDNYCQDVEEILGKYRGTWRDTEEFTEELLSDIYGSEIDALPPILQYSIDYSIAARDLFLTDFVFVEHFNLVFESY